MPDPVGREDVLARLRGVVESCRDGAGSLLLLTGEAGIGKTAMLAGAARHAEALGAAVAWGWGWPGDGAPGYWPWIQILRSLDLAPVLTTATDGGGSPASARFALFDEVAAALAGAARERPIVILLDDLHWADPPSLLLLDFLTRRLPRTRVAVIGSYRGGPADAALADLAARSTVLPLAGLPLPAVAELVAELLGRPAADEVATEVHRRTGGNPFFVHQLAWLIRDGQHGVPPGVREAIRQRCGLLGADCLDALGRAAVLGQSFSAALLARVTGTPAGTVAAALDEAVRAGILAGDAPDGYRFAHDLFREHLYDELPPATRAEIHLRIGGELAAARTAGAEIPLAELAWHHVHADPLSAAARHYSIEAAREATARLAYEDAVHHWERALTAAGDSVRDRIDTLLELAEARRRAGAADAAEAEFFRVADLARRHGDSRALAYAALGLHAIGSRSGHAPGPVRAALGRYPGAAPARLPAADLAAALSEAHAALSADGADERLRLRVQAGLARVLAWHDLDLPRARRLAAEAVEAARALDDPAVLAVCLLAGHNVEWGPSALPQHRALAIETVELGRRIGDPDVVIEAQLLLATGLLELGDPGFRPALEEMLRLAETSTQPRWRYAALVRRAMLAQMAGRFAEAERFTAEAKALGADYGEPDTDDVWYTQMWDIRTDQGRRGELADIATSGFPDPAPPTGRGFELLGRIAAGVTDMSVRQMMRLIADDPGRPTSDSRLFVTNMVFAAEGAVALGNEPFAAQVYDLLAPFAAYAAVAGAAVTFRGAVAHHLGILAAAMGSADIAVVHLRDAVAIHERLGAFGWALRSRYELARLLRGDPATRHDAGEMLAEVAREARRLDMAQLARDAEADIPPAVPVSAGFTRAGAVWTLDFAGETVRMRDAKGLRDLATLLASPGRPIAAADLVAAGAGEAAQADLGLGADEIFDATARRQIRARLADLAEEIAEAERWADPERAARAAAEKDALIRELSAAAGFAGAPRRLGDQWERARKAVTGRIRDVIDRIGRVHPALGAHLAQSVTTGTHCAYSPQSPVAWRL